MMEDMSLKTFQIRLLLIISIVTSNLDGGQCLREFRVFWNIPTSNCAKVFGIDLQVRKYGIQMNPKDGWVGAIITIFYGEEMGVYPYVNKTNYIINGGIPQLVDLDKHLNKCMNDINAWIPDVNFTGLAIIDWEEWRPLWDRNWDSKNIYRQLSETLVRHQHPTWAEKLVKEEAKKAFTEAARELFTSTLQLAKKMRPGGQWGYYLFPECYNHKDERNCTKIVQERNDQLSWLFNTSSALYPSMYLHHATGRNNTNFCHGQMVEAIRVNKASLPVYVYSRFRYDATHWYTQTDLENSISQAWRLGMDGIVLWDDHKLEENASICKQAALYLRDSLGPLVTRVLLDDEQCTKERCNGNGRCMLKDISLLKANNVQYARIFHNGEWKTVPQLHDLKSVNYKRKTMKDWAEYRCKCFKGFYGDFCNKRKPGR